MTDRVTEAFDTLTGLRYCWPGRVARHLCEHDFSKAEAWQLARMLGDARGIETDPDTWRRLFKINQAVSDYAYAKGETWRRR